MDYYSELKNDLIPLYRLKTSLWNNNQSIEEPSIMEIKENKISKFYLLPRSTDAILGIFLKVLSESN